MVRVCQKVKTPVSRTPARMCGPVRIGRDPSRGPHLAWGLLASSPPDGWGCHPVMCIRWRGCHADFIVKCRACARRFLKLSALPSGLNRRSDRARGALGVVPAEVTAATHDTWVLVKISNLPGRLHAFSELGTTHHTGEHHMARHTRIGAVALATTFVAALGIVACLAGHRVRRGWRTEPRGSGGRAFCC